MTRTIKILVLAVIAVAVAVPTAYTTFVHSERAVVIGAHEATLRPSFDGYARIESGPLLPSVRIPAAAPLGIGVSIALGESEVSDLNALVARDAVIASQPQGEIEAVRDQIVSMLTDSALRGAGSGTLVVLLTVLAWRATGPDRRQALWATARQPSRRQVVGAVGVAAVAVAASVLIAIPERPQPSATRWVPISSVFPDLPADRVLDNLEIADSASASGSRAVVEGALATYRASVEFYGKLALQAATEEVRTPLEGETTAVVVTDRHDNIGMDPVARAIADRARASLLIDLGDDTSSGASWETFSVNSLAREFDGFDVVSVAGNHDNGPTIGQQMKDKGFTVLDGEPVTVAGVRFLGSSDPRSSGLTSGYNGNESDNLDAIRAQDAELTKAACDDGEVSVIAVHSPSSAKEAAKSGCVDLVLSGHLHRQVGPTVLAGDAGSTVTLSTGSTGGAVYAFALGSKLRRNAQVTIVTFADGRPVGLQPVNFEPGGIISVEEYFAMTPPPRVSGSAPQ